MADTVAKEINNEVLTYPGPPRNNPTRQLKVPPVQMLFLLRLAIHQLISGV